jgi:hypothetical protein
VSEASKFPRPSAEALQKHPLHTARIGKFLFCARRSDDGLWHDDERIMPWFCLLRWSGPEVGGGKVKIGAWIIGVTWGRAIGGGDV